MPRFLGLGNGSDGVINLSSYTPLSYSCSGSSGSYSLTATGSFSAGQRLFIIQSRGSGVGNYEDNQVVSYSPGTVSLLFPLEHTYTDSGASQAQVIIVKQASSVNGSITVPAWNGDVGGVFVMACNGIFNGSVNAYARGFMGGQSDPYDGKYGENHLAPSGGGYQTDLYGINWGNGGGGGHGSNCTDCTNEHGNGAGGGNGTPGGNGTRYPGDVWGGHDPYGGTTSGNANLTNMTFGGGGGGTGNVNNGALWFRHDAMEGANGGGIIVVYAGEIVSSALLNANGGEAREREDARMGYGGNGAGGSILVKARKVSIGSSRILATGGTYGPGGYGGVGRIRIEACSLSGTTNPGASTAIGGHNYCGVLAGMI